MRTVSFGPSTRKLPVPADTAFSKISMLRNGIILVTDNYWEQIDLFSSVEKREKQFS